LPTEHASLDLIKIRSAYRKKALLLHPDKNPDNIASATEAFKKLQNAFEKLVHILKRSI
jgi:curved DNA-binding protein CbpA